MNECPTCTPANECECNMPEKLLKLADEAWFELLKEKIKGRIQQTCDEKMNKLAELVADTNQQRWIHMIQGKMKCEEYKESIKDLFAQAGCDQS